MGTGGDLTLTETYPDHAEDDVRKSGTIVVISAARNEIMSTEVSMGFRSVSSCDQSHQTLVSNDLSFHPVKKTLKKVISRVSGILTTRRNQRGTMKKVRVLLVIIELFVTQLSQLGDHETI